MIVHNARILKHNCCQAKRFGKMGLSAVALNGQTNTPTLLKARQLVTILRAPL